MKIKNVSGTDLSVPWLGDRLVVAEQEVAVPEGTVFAYTQQEQTWQPADAEAQAEHDEGLEACAVALIEQGREAELVVTVASAQDLVKGMSSVTREQAAGLLSAEQARPEPRVTVVGAAEKRIAELDAELARNNDGGNAEGSEQR